MLGRLMSLLILLGVAYLILTQALPYLKKQPGGGGTSATGGEIDSVDGRCLDEAIGADERLTRTARNFGQPPVDVDSWSQAVWEVESDIQAARTSCGCLSDTCQAASRALDEMSSLLANLDGMIRGDSPGFANPGNQQEKIQHHLDRARQAAGF